MIKCLLFISPIERKENLNYWVANLIIVTLLDSLKFFSFSANLSSNNKQFHQNLVSLHQNDIKYR